VGLKEEEIIEYITSKGFNLKEKSFVWCNKMPSNSDYFTFGSLANLNIKYYIIVFLENDIMLIPVVGIKTMKDYILISKKEVKLLKFKKAIISYNVIIKTSKNTVKLRINKFMIGANWHKENLKIILEQYNHKT
jgi:hypothetical protein